jgi:hypothetical protein
VLANVSELGPLERYIRGECWRWYEVGVHLTVEANMTHTVSPFLLVSWQDLLNTMLDRGASVEIMAKTPYVLHRLLLHSEFTQPMYLIVSYWLKLFLDEVWANQTFLNQAGAVLHNTSFFLQEPHTRRLLMTKGDEPYSRKLHSTTVINTDVSSQTVYEWGQGPYAWPPNFVYWETDNSCAVVSTALSVVKNGLDATIKFYREPVIDPKPVTWPKLPVRMEGGNWSNISLPTSFDINNLDSIPQTARDVLSSATVAWLDEDEILHFLANAP